MAPNPVTPPHRTRSSNVASYCQVSSTPHKLSRSSIESSSGTHESLDRYVVNELDGRVLVDIDDFAEKWILPPVERRLFDWVVNDVLQGTKDEDEWKMPGMFSDRGYLPWVGRRMRDVCDRARRTLESCLIDALRDRIGNTSIGDLPDQPSAAAPADPDPTTEWVSRLRCRMWTTKPGNMVGGIATRAVDIALSASPNEPERWDTVLILGEHKSQASVGARRVATTQLAGYAGEMFGVQSFRHYIPGFSLLKDQIQLWVFDRMGCFASSLISMSTDELESRRTFIELILAFSLMDYAALGFDRHVYGDASCTTMWIPPTILPNSNEVTAYIRLSEEVFQLRRILSIRPGLVCRGTRCFLATLMSSEANVNGDSNNTSNYIVKMSWRFEGLCPEGTLLERVGRNPGVCNVVRVHAHDEQLDVHLGIRKGMLEGQHFAVSEPMSHRIFKSKASDDIRDTLLNRVFTRTVLCDAGRSLTEAVSALELLQAVRDSFIGMW
jgi:Fungal protein kinase